MLEKLKAINASASFNRWAGFEVTNAADGEAELRLAWRSEDMGQYSGFLHAGLIAGLLDTACGFAAVSVVGPVLASQFSVNCLAPAVGRQFSVRGRVVKAGRRQVFATAELYAQREEGDERLVASGSAILVPLETPTR